MNVSDSVLSRSEKSLFALRQLYRDRGYRPYRMGKFEPYDLYAANKEFLLSDHVITFTDTDGKLMALKPDVTLSIIKNSRDLPEETQRVYYNENVYRVSKGTGAFSEIMQAGVECFGAVDGQALAEVVGLAAESLALLAPRAVLALSDLDVLQAVLDRLGPDGETRGRLYQAIGERNTHEIRALCADHPDRAAAELIPRIRKGGAVIDAGNIPDLVPPLAAVAAASPGESRFVNAGRLRLKESDRLQSVCAMLKALGAEAEEKPEELIIRGKQTLRGGVVDSFRDHRIAMSAAVAALACREPVTILGAEAVEKSYPAFWQDYRRLGGRIREEEA